MLGGALSVMVVFNADAQRGGAHAGGGGGGGFSRGGGSVEGLRMNGTVPRAAT